MEVEDTDIKDNKDKPRLQFLVQTDTDLITMPCSSPVYQRTWPELATHEGLDSLETSLPIKVDITYTQGEADFNIKEITVKL